MFVKVLLVNKQICRKLVSLRGKWMDGVFIDSILLSIFIFLFKVKLQLFFEKE